MWTAAQWQAHLAAKVAPVASPAPAGVAKHDVLVGDVYEWRGDETHNCKRGARFEVVDLGGSLCLKGGMRVLPSAGVAYIKGALELGNLALVSRAQNAERVQGELRVGDVCRINDMKASDCGWDKARLKLAGRVSTHGRVLWTCELMHNVNGSWKRGDTTPVEAHRLELVVPGKEG